MVDFLSPKSSLLIFLLLL